MGEGVPRVDDTLLSVEMVAERLGVQPTTVYRWCREGRLACLKPGKSWRVPTASLEVFLRQSSRPRSLLDLLRVFVAMPDHLVAVAQDEALLQRLEAAFFRLGAEQDALLVKFLSDTDDTTRPQETLREGLGRYGLAVDRLEAEGRFCWSTAVDPEQERGTTLGRILTEATRTGTPVWATFNWTRDVDLGQMVAQQEGLAALVDPSRLVVATAAVEAATQDWSPTTLRQAQASRRGLIRIGWDGLVLSRLTPLPEDESLAVMSSTGAPAGAWQTS